MDQDTTGTVTTWMTDADGRALAIFVGTFAASHLTSLLARVVLSKSIKRRRRRHGQTDGKPFSSHAFEIGGVCILVSFALATLVAFATKSPAVLSTSPQASQHRTQSWGTSSTEVGRLLDAQHVSWYSIGRDSSPDQDPDRYHTQPGSWTVRYVGPDGRGATCKVTLAQPTWRGAQATHGCKSSPENTPVVVDVSRRSQHAALPQGWTLDSAVLDTSSSDGTTVGLFDVVDPQGRRHTACTNVPWRDKAGSFPWSTYRAALRCDGAYVMTGR